MLVKTLKTALLTTLALSAVMYGCAKGDSKGDSKDEDKKDGADPNNTDTATDTSTDTTTADDKVTLSGKLSAGTALLDGLADLEMFCVTFEETPVAAKSEFGADGAFSLQMPKGVNFGCFVNNKTTKVTVASIVITAEKEGFGGGQTAMALSGSVDLGALVIGTDGTIKVPASALASVKAEVKTGIVADDLNNTEYTMECQDNGNAEQLAACKEQLLHDGQPATVYFRILKGKEDGTDVTGLGVWQSKAAFDACGGFDMSAADQASASKDGIELSTVSVGEFTLSEDCKKREDQEDKPAGHENIQNYYALAKLEANGGGFSFRSEGDYQFNDCVAKHSTAIEMTGTNAVMYGAFTNSDSKVGECGGQGTHSSISTFSVKFTKK